MSAEDDRFKKMVEGSQDWFWEFDENANFTYVSPRIRDLLGYAPEEILGLNAFDLMDEQEAARVHRHFDPVAEKYLPFTNLINVNLHKDGHEVVIESSGTPIFDETGRFRGYRGIDRDITARRLTEDLLQESTSKLKDIIETSTEWIWEMDISGRHTYSNDALGSILGYSAVEFIGKDYTEFLYADDLDEVTRLLPDCIANKRGWQGWVLRWRHKDGSIRWLESNAKPVLGAAGEVVGFRGADRDITERKYYERLLEKARDAAESNNRAKDEFIANMSHELRTPITAILGFAELLDGTELSETQHAYLNTIMTSSDELLGLVNDLLDIARIEAGKMRIECTDFDLRRLVGEIVSRQNPSAQAKQLSLRSQVGDDVPDRLKGDPLRLKQILLNLLVNAVKFTEKGEITFSVSVEERQPSSSLLRFDVADTGVGLKREDLERIFLPFCQVESSSSRRFGGAGLGLTICAKLCAMMGGEIWANSSQELGSTFHVRLPFEAGDAGTSACVGSDAAIGAEQGGLHILLVEDYEISQRFFSEALQRYGYRIDLAGNGVEALARLKANRYDLILMDLQMPVLDGWETAARIREAEKQTGEHVPIIALTAHAMEKSRAEALERGFDGYATKPLKIRALLDEIERCRS